MASANPTNKLLINANEKKHCRIRSRRKKGISTFFLARHLTALGYLCGLESHGPDNSVGEVEVVRRGFQPSLSPQSVKFEFRNSELLAGSDADDNADIVDDEGLLISDLDP